MPLELHLLKRGSPYYVQLRDQIIHAICTGRLNPGDRLPTVNELGEQYGISKNTALRAYQELEREGWVTNGPRKGTIAQNPLLRGANTSGLVVEAVRRFHDTLDHVRTAGITGEQFTAVASRLISERLSEPFPGSDYLALVSDDPYGAPQDVADIETATGMKTRWVPLADLRIYGVWVLGDIRRLRMVVTSFYRYREVLQHLGSLPIPVFTATVTTDPQVLAQAAKFNRPDLRVAVIAHDPEYFEALSFFVSQCLFDAKIVGYASLSDREGVHKLVRHADVIVSNYWATNPEQNLDITQGKPTLPLGTRLDPNSLKILRQALESGSSPGASRAILPGA